MTADVDGKTPAAAELFVALAAAQRFRSRPSTRLTQLVRVGSEVKDEAVLTLKAPPAMLALQPTRNFFIIFAVRFLDLVLLCRLNINLHQYILLLVVKTFCWVVQVLYHFIILHLLSTTLILSHKTPGVYNSHKE